MSNYAVVPRRLYKHTVFRSKQEAALFVWMVTEANWRPGHLSTAYGPIKLERGELLIAQNALAADFGFTRKKIRTLLAKMETEGLITLRTSSRAGTVLVINKYGEYQRLNADNVTPSLGPDGGHHKGQEKARKTDVRGPEAVDDISMQNQGDAGHQASSRASRTDMRGPYEDQEKARKGPDSNTGNTLNTENPKRRLEATPLSAGADESASGNLFPTAEIVRLKVADDVRQAVDLWNAMAVSRGLAQVRSPDRLSPRRRRCLIARLRECGGIEGWKIALEKVASNPFLCGETGKWSAGFDFLLQQSSFTKLMEDQYRQRRPQSQVPRSNGDRLAERLGYGRPTEPPAHLPTDPFDPAPENAPVLK